MAEVSRTTADTAADVIHDETTANANTAARVGQMFRDIIDSAVWNNKGLASARPASSTVTGDHYFATDTGALSIWDGTTWVDIGGGSGETNTASNLAGGDEGVFSAKVGADLRFSPLAGTGGIAVARNGDVIEIDGSGVGGGADFDTLAELNAILTDATLDDVSGARTPTAHASTHETGGSDALDGGNLAYAASPTNYTAGSATTGGHFSGIDAALGLTSLTDGSRAYTNPVSGVTPTADAHLTTKAYVDALAQGLDVKPSVRAVATANQATLSGTAQTIDGFALNAVGMRVLLTAQSTATQNGIWVVQSGAWTRPTDFDTGDQAAGAFTFVESGTANADSGWVCTSNTGADVIDTDNLAWTQFSGAGQITAGAGLTKSGNTLDVAAHADGSITVAADTVQATMTLAQVLAQAADGNDVAVTNVATVSLNDAPTNAAHATRKDYVDARAPTKADKNLTCLAVTTDGALATNSTLTATSKGYVRVYLHNVADLVIGDGVTTGCDAFWTTDDGATAEASDDVPAGAELYYNAVEAEYELTTDDRLSFHYQV